MSQIPKVNFKADFETDGCSCALEMPHWPRKCKPLWGGETHQNLPVEVKSPFLEGCNRCVDVAFGTGLSGGLGRAGEWLGLMVSEGFSNLSGSVVLLTVLQTLIPHLGVAQVSFRQCFPLSVAPRVSPHLRRRGNDGHLPSL